MTFQKREKKKPNWIDSGKPLVCGHAVVLWEDASRQPGEKQAAKDSSVAPQHGRYQQDGSSTQGWEKQHPVVENWFNKQNEASTIEFAFF